VSNHLLCLDHWSERRIEKSQMESTHPDRHAGEHVAHFLCVLSLLLFAEYLTGSLAMLSTS
jgi:hypothetical protein